jgi:hypothetical protein
MSQTIEVTISPQGETRIETRGFTGAACREATRALEAALGIRKSERLTGEFYATSQHSEQQRQNQ